MEHERKIDRLKLVMEAALPMLCDYKYELIESKGSKELTWSRLRKNDLQHIVNIRPNEDDILLIIYSDKATFEGDSLRWSFNSYRSEKTFSLSNPDCFKQLTEELSKLQEQCA